MNDYHPILFNGEMVRAILAGRKTQTRRLVLDPFTRQPHVSSDVVAFAPANGQSWQAMFAAPGAADGMCPKSWTYRCPYGVPGDLLWVREAWREVSSAMMADGRIPSQPARCVYRADRPWDGPWRPSIHMPRWASRITLLVTGVRIERVQDISESDAIAEGCMYAGHGDDWLRPDSFLVLWDAINAKRGAGWDANPWVWVVEFRPLAALGEE